MLLKKYLKKVLIFSILIGLIAFILYSTLLKEYYLPVFPYLFLFFILINISVHWFMMSAGKKRPATFSAYYMGTVSLKLFIYLIFLVIYVLADKKNAAVFIVSFFILYVLFSVFETVALLKDFKKQEISPS